MPTRGIDIRQNLDRIVFRASLKDAAGAEVSTGTTELRVLRLNDDGTTDVYDWTTNAFVATGSGTPDDETTMTHQNRRDSTGADVATGIWTKVLSILTNFTENQVYILKVTNTGASPPSQEREIQYGGVEGSEGYARAVDSTVFGVVAASPTPTNTVFALSAISTALYVNDQLKGLVLKFPKNTATTSLKNQGTRVVSHTTASGLPLLTVEALTTQPQAGDLVVIQ